MQYIVVDLHGNSRDSFDSREELVDALAEAEADRPSSTENLYIVTYDDDGAEVGETQRADELLRTRVVRLPLNWGATSELPVASSTTDTMRPAARPFVVAHR